jgi:acetyl-CoA acyltransferase
VTAATSSPLTDGAAATLICEEQYAKDNNLEILGRIVSTSVQGCKADTMGLGPIGASQKALARANLSIKDIDIVELNEAFASQSLACIKDLKIDPSIVNLDGGALALGHPLGATGARITGKVAQLLKRENKKYALASQCIGLGMGIATIIESVD